MFGKEDWVFWKDLALAGYKYDNDHIKNIWLMPVFRSRHPESGSSGS